MLYCCDPCCSNSDKKLRVKEFAVAYFHKNRFPTADGYVHVPVAHESSFDMPMLPTVLQLVGLRDEQVCFCVTSTICFQYLYRVFLDF